MRKHKRKVFWAITALIILFIYLYQESRPTLIFHTPVESGYLGKVSTFSGAIDKLYIEDHIAKYRLPHIWNWKDDDEIAIFMRNYGDVFKKKDMDFWRLDVYLDENGRYKSHAVRKYFWMK